MTNQPVDPAVPIDLSQARAAIAESEASKAEAAGVEPPATMKLRIGRREFDLVPKLTVNDQAVMQDAFESDSVRQIAEAMQRLVRKPQREELISYLLDDPDDDDDRIDLDDVFEAYKNAQEQMAARPTGK